MIDLLMEREKILKALAECGRHAPAEKREKGPYSDWYMYQLALVADLNHVNDRIARAAHEIYMEAKKL